jgi:hypothetical protein
MGNVVNALAVGFGADEIEVTAVVPAYVQSSDPVDMQNRLVALITEQATVGNRVLDISLGGAGDGHSFLGTLNLYTPAGPVTPLALDVYCYVAASEAELPAAYANATAEYAARHPNDLADWKHIGHTVVGSSAGHRFMGIVIAKLSDNPTP